MKLIKGMNLLDLDIQYFATSSAMSMANKYLKYSITITENWQDKINAISNVTVVVKAWRTNTGYTSYDDGGTCYCKIDGTTYSQGITVSQKVTYNSNTVFFEKTLNIPHNTDGSKTLTCSAWFSGSDVFSASEQSYSQPLTYIPRASSVTCNSFYIGDSTTITIGRNSDTFTHTLKYTYGDLTGTIETKTNLISVGWTPDKASFYSRIPNGRTGYGSITCETYSGNTLVGTSTTNFNAYAKQDECTPTVTATIVDTNEDTKKLTGDSSKLIKYLSKPKVTITATPKFSSTIKSRKMVWGDGQTSTAAETTFNDGVTIPSLSVSATDSREYPKTTTYDLSSKWVEYVKLAFSNISLTREESTLSTAKVKVSGNYFNGSFGSVTNAFTLKYRYKANEAGSYFTNYIQVDPAKTNDTFDFTATLQNIDYQKEYIFEFVLEDEAMIVYSGEQILEKGEAIFRIGEDYTRTNGRMLNENGAEIGKANASGESVGNASMGDLSIEWGKVVVTPVANTPTTQVVYFNKTYTEPPVVIVTASTGVIGTGVQGVAVAGIAKNYATLVITRINTVPTGIHFAVIGKVV